MMAWAAPTLALAYGADLVLGDPWWFPHPVRGLGWGIHHGERLLRAVLPWERVAGLLLVAVIVGGAWAGSAWLLAWVSAQTAWGGLALGVLLTFSCLSTRDLARESWAVHQALAADDLPGARRRVARIVGRDCGRLDAPEVTRATIETIAESVLDGILSPLFYFALGGPPGAVAYKAINTLDSMIGHRSARYVQFGWGAALLDTWANWLPARWAAVVCAAAAPLSGYPAGPAWRHAWRDGAHGTVPNAGIPEAAFAGALGVRLGGINWYEGRPVPMGALGPGDRPLTPGRIPEAIRLMYGCSLVAWMMTMGVVSVRGLW